jgi:hypothetical protein
MKAIIEINLLGLKGTMLKVEKFENGLYYINVPFLNEQRYSFLRYDNEFKVCDELKDEIIAIFYNQQDAIDYINFKTNKQTTF